MMRFLHDMKFADPTGELNPWTFSRKIAAEAGLTYVPMLGHSKIFSEPGVVDWGKLKSAAEALPPGPVMLNVEGRENRCFDNQRQLIPENVEKRIAIAQCVRQHGSSGLKLGFFDALPPCEPWLVTGHDANHPQERREDWDRLVQELKPLARHVDCCFLECYPSRDWPAEAVHWHIRRTVWAAKEVYHLPAYVTFFVSGWYPEWKDVPAETLAQMANRIPGPVFRSWLNAAEDAGVDGVHLFGGKVANGNGHILWDEFAEWWTEVLTKLTRLAAEGG